MGSRLFSFFPTKNITTGEGGMITCNSRKLYEKFKMMAAHGISTQSIEREKNNLPWTKIAEIPGHNFRLSNLLAALGYAQLKRIKLLNKHRIKAAQRYNNFILKNNLPVTIPFVSRHSKHVYQTYAINVNPKIRNKILIFLRKRGIGASVHFTPPLHEQKYFKKNYPPRVKLYNASKLSRSLISLPMHSKIKNREIDYVCNALKLYYSKNV